MPFHFQDKLKNGIQNTILTFIFNTINGNGNSINCRLFNVLLIFALDFKVFHSFFILQMKHSACFSFFIFNGKMKKELQITLAVLIKIKQTIIPQQACFKRLWVLHEQVLPSSPRIARCTRMAEALQDPLFQRIIFSSFFMLVAPYFLWLIFLSFFDWFHHMMKISEDSAQNYKHFHQSVLLISYCIYCRT